MARISVKSLYDDVAKLARKTRGGGFIDDDTFNLHLQNAEKAMLQRCYAAYEQSQDIADYVRPFVVFNSITQTDTKGVMAFPDDYAHRLAVEGLYISNPAVGGSANIQRFECPMLKTHEVANFLSSTIAKPDFAKRRFYHTYRNNSIQVFPERVMWVGFTYLRHPVYGKIVFTASEFEGQDVFTYDPAASLDLEWDDIAYKDFVTLVCQQLGISTSDNEFMAMNQQTMMDNNSLKQQQ